MRTLVEGGAKCLSIAHYYYCKLFNSNIVSVNRSTVGLLALALLDRIVSVDKQHQWLLYLSNSGYLKVLVDSLVDDDRTLQSLLTPQPPLLKALYTYESKMVRLCGCWTL